ncbi:MAG TPA: metal-dependent hydrolase [Holosporales bacterium]|nr:metal-dependent hydrolase [Holosporales bacterium]
MFDKSINKPHEMFGLFEKIFNSLFIFVFMIVYDNHFHMDSNGKGVEAVKEFEKSGGTAMMVVSKPYIEIKRGEDFMREYEILLSLVRDAKEKTGVKIFTALGVHPSRISDFKSLDKAKKIMVEGIELAARCVGDGKANAIGEVGRPHYETSPEVWDASNEVMEYAMMRAKDVGCAVIIHSESSDKTYEEISQIAGKVGIKKGRVIKHFSPIVKSTFGLTPSVIATFENAKNAFEKMDSFLLESDYIDDPKRPGAVIGPKTLPKTVKRLIENSVTSEKNINFAMKELPEKIYGINLD